MSRTIVETDKIAPAVGAFSTGVKASGFILASGQIALDPASGKLIAGDVGAPMGASVEIEGVIGL